MKWRKTQTGERTETRYGDYEISKCPRGWAVTWISPAFSGDEDMVVAITKTKPQAMGYVKRAMQAKGLNGLGKGGSYDPMYSGIRPGESFQEYMKRTGEQAQERKYDWIQQEEYLQQREDEKRTAPPLETNEQKAQKWEKRMWIPIGLSLLGIGALWFFGRRK